MVATHDLCAKGQPRANCERHMCAGENPEVSDSMRSARRQSAQRVADIGHKCGSQGVKGMRGTTPRAALGYMFGSPIAYNITIIHGYALILVALEW